MSFRVTYRGLLVECDSLADVNRLADQVEAKPRPRSAETNGAAPVLPKSDRIRLAVEGLSDSQKQLITTLLEAVKTETGLVPQHVLNPNPAAIGATMTNIQRVVQRFGLSLDDLIERHHSRNGAGKRTSHYSLASAHQDEIAAALN